MEPLVRRPDEYRAGRSHVRLPADVSFVGGVVATGALLGPRRLGRDRARNFPRSDFWDDVVNWDCTLFQYIGELVPLSRQCAAAPARARSIACGCAAATDCAPTSGKNSNRASTFREFWNSMPRPKATSRSTMSRAKSAPSAACRRSSTHRFPLALVQFDAASGEPARDDDGRCIRCATDEVGEAIGRISRGTAEAGGGEFEGYTSAADTERKILRDVFEPGDAWYRTGDLMRMDASGFYLFRRPHRRHLPLEGRKRGDLRSRRRAHGRSPASPRRPSTASRFPAPKAPPAWRRWSPTAHLDLADLRAHLARRLPRLCAAAVPAAQGRHRRRRRRSSTRQSSLCARASISPSSRDPIYFDDPQQPSLCAARRRALRAHRGRENPALGRDRKILLVSPAANYLDARLLRETVNAYGRLRGNRSSMRGT